MSNEKIYENVPVVRNLLPSSASDHHFNRNNSLSSRFGESLPSMNTNNEQITPIQPNLPRFPDDIADVDNDNLDRTSSQTVPISSAGQLNADDDQHPPSNTNNETHESDKEKTLDRWDDAWEKHEQKLKESNEIPEKNEKINETIDSPPAHPIHTPSIGITRVHVRELFPTSARDPTFAILRDLFVRSFDEFYKQIETQLNLNSQKNLIQWLDETFNEEQEAILSGKYRCFVLYGNENQDPKEIIVGFLTLREEQEGSVYIAQVAVRLDIKRRGYGAQLLQHLRNLYPPNTQYWGLCRRANRPALQFYLKQGATFMKNDEVANKYGYDPALYAGFEFVDTVPVIASPMSSLPRHKPPVDNPEQQATTITDVTPNDQVPPSATDDQQIPEQQQQKPPRKIEKIIGNTCLTRPKSPSIPDIPEKPPPLPLLSIQESSTESLPDGITLIWLDTNACHSSTEDTNNTLSYLRRLGVASIRPFSDVSSCLAFIQSISYDKNTSCSKIFLIVSGRFSIQILPTLKSSPVVDSVFIFCMNGSNYRYLMKEYEPLIVDICTEIQDLYNCINKQIEGLNQSTFVCQFFLQEQNTTRNLTKDAASFLWFQLFQIIMSELKSTDSEKNLMLKHCSKQLEIDAKLRKLLPEITLFRDFYTSKDAILWYTKETFVYRLLNTALRTEDIDALYIFRFFIADLCRQLKAEHKKLSEQYSDSPILTVYRGGYVSCQEIDKLKRIDDNLISLNGFISTSKKQWVAMQFIKKQKSRQENVEKVLFIIEVDIRCEHIICADVTEMSAQKVEEEVLFNMGTAFHVNKMIFDDDQKIWNVFMTATEDGIKAAYDYMQLIHQELTDDSVAIIFGQLFLHIGNYLKAQEYFLDLSQHSKQDDPDLPGIRFHLGLTYGYQEDFSKAEDCLKEVYQHHLLAKSKSNNLHLARTKNALGWIYHQNGELEEAMVSYETALVFAEERLDLNHLINAQTYSHMGDLYLEKHKFYEAKKCYEEALEIERRRLPANHPRIGVTLNDLGDVFRKRKEMEQAFKYYEQAEVIFLKNLPSHHPYTAYCWSCMAFVYLYDGKIKEAKEYHEKALKIYQRILPSDHTNIKISEKNLNCIDFQKINDTYVKICARV